MFFIDEVSMYDCLLICCTCCVIALRIYSLLCCARFVFDVLLRMYSLRAVLLLH